MIRICSLQGVTLPAFGCRRALATAALVVMLGSLSACSSGTEVGNGLKPHDQDPGTSPASGRDTTTTNASAPGAPDSSAPTTAAAGAGEGKMTPSGAAGTAGAVPLPADLGELDVAFASCASPLAKDVSNMTTTYSVSIGSGAATKFIVQKNADATSWDIVDTNAVVWRKILVNGTNTNSTYGVTATDANGRALGLGYQCAAVATTTNVTLAGQTAPVTKRTVTLTETATGRTKQLVWYLTAVANTTKVNVPRVELTDLATGVVTMFAAIPAN
jgi:hypothetical protein